MFLGTGRSNSSQIATIESLRVILLITLLGKYLVYWSERDLSQTTSSQSFFPLASRIGLEQKSNSQLNILSGSASGSR